MKPIDPAKAGWSRLPDGADYREIPPHALPEQRWTGIVRESDGFWSWLVNLEAPFVRGRLGGIETSRARAVTLATRVAVAALGAV